MKKIIFKRGFTLIELLVVVGIIAVLAAIVLSLLSDGRKRGVDAAVKQNLANARSQAEVFYNTTGAGTYTSVCGVAGVGGVGPLVLAAAKARGLSTYVVNSASAPSTATCNHSSTAWAVEVPLLSDTGSFWCVDSTGISDQKSASSFSAADDYTCI